MSDVAHENLQAYARIMDLSKYGPMTQAMSDYGIRALSMPSLDTPSSRAIGSNIADMLRLAPSTTYQNRPTTSTQAIIPYIPGGISGGYSCQGSSCGYR
ncbi:hypothetical protein COY27_04275 [Candidatus Woesearchaeota archaeon CG_4_10_14_0_2_um_filter_33_13]|nr:MAG: hypothetical protein COY27_04275 [Candidatus Woesearchaeota archaeon CG_4_10_14_0_2_um_filter_33_13]